MPTDEVRGRKILVVDDDSDWRLYLREALDDLGYDTVEAADGEAALRWLAEEECSIMLLDLSMPGMGGEEVIDHLPKDPPRVVLLTAAPAEAVRDMLRKGVDYYLPKGASREELSLMLQSLSA